jgi:hypothetical protein
MLPSQSAWKIRITHAHIAITNALGKIFFKYFLYCKYENQNVENDDFLKGSSVTSLQKL